MEVHCEAFLFDFGPPLLSAPSSSAPLCATFSRRRQGLLVPLSCISITGTCIEHRCHADAKAPTAVPAGTRARLASLPAPTTGNRLVTFGAHVSEATARAVVGAASGAVGLAVAAGIETNGTALRSRSTNRTLRSSGATHLAEGTANARGGRPRSDATSSTIRGPAVVYGREATRTGTLSLALTRATRETSFTLVPAELVRGGIDAEAFRVAAAVRAVPWAARCVWEVAVRRGHRAVLDRRTRVVKKRIGAIEDGCVIHIPIHED
jgi:hypothetical protein